MKKPRNSSHLRVFWISFRFYHITKEFWLSNLSSIKNNLSAYESQYFYVLQGRSFKSPEDFHINMICVELLLIFCLAKMGSYGIFSVFRSEEEQRLNQHFRRFSKQFWRYNTVVVFVDTFRLLKDFFLSSTTSYIKREPILCGKSLELFFMRAFLGAIRKYRDLVKFKYPKRIEVY